MEVFLNLGFGFDFATTAAERVGGLEIRRVGLTLAVGLLSESSSSSSSSSSSILIDLKFLLEVGVGESEESVGSLRLK